MKMLICGVVVFSFAFTVCAEEPLVIRNQDLEQRYGGSGDVRSDAGVPAGSSDPCVVINYDSYNETARTTRPGAVTMNQQRIGDTSYGSGIVTGGQVIEQKMATYLTVSVRNTSGRVQRIDTKDIRVYTIKGNVVSPGAGKIEYVSVGETVTITGLKFNPISEIANVKVSCY